MLTRLRIRNFKRFQDVDIELGDVVVSRANNAGRRRRCRRWALWELWRARWSEKRLNGCEGQGNGGGGGQEPHRCGDQPAGSPGTAHPRDLASVARTCTCARSGAGRSEEKTLNIRIRDPGRGVTDGEAWATGIEFDYANAESIYCRAMGAAPDADGETGGDPCMPMRARCGWRSCRRCSGLAAHEDVAWKRGSVQVRLGEGRTADVLRNLCHQLATETPGGWMLLVKRMKDLFGVTIEAPEYIVERASWSVSYRRRAGSTSTCRRPGAACSRPWLLLAYILNNPGSVLLLDDGRPP